MWDTTSSIGFGDAVFKWVFGGETDSDYSLCPLLMLCLSFGLCLKLEIVNKNSGSFMSVLVQRQLWVVSP